MATIPSRRRPGTFAVVIGIDKYDEYQPLKGAVADSERFSTFLRDDLNVPTSHICVLQNEEASRNDILSAFSWLRDRRDDANHQTDSVNIVIYFAGHGLKSAGAHSALLNGDSAMLCPSDMGVLKDTGAGLKEVTPGITVGEIVSLLVGGQFSIRKKLFTFIFDCCYSGQMLQGIRGPFTWHSRRGAFRTSTSRLQGPYVLLTASGRDQRSYEDNNNGEYRGIFTGQLLPVLQKHLRHLTYVSLIQMIQVPKNFMSRQTPHCEGDGIFLRLFDSESPAGDPSFIPTRRTASGSIILEAGQAEGITLGSLFTAQAFNLIHSPAQSNPVIASLEVTSVDTNTSQLNISPHYLSTGLHSLPHHFYSKLDKRRAGWQLSLFSTDRLWLESIFPEDFLKESPARIVQDVSLCNVELDVMDGRVRFTQHTVWSHFRSPSMVRANDVDAIRSVINGAYHFYYHLTRSATTTFDHVCVEVEELRREQASNSGLVFYPTGKNLVKDGVVQVHAEETYLGVRIRNDGRQPLYPYLFYFDPNDLTICSWYMPPIAAGTIRGDAPLLPYSHITVGYGNGRDPAWQFEIPTGSDSEVGIFRLFLCTERVNLECILQPDSPFQAGAPRGPKPILLEVLEATWAVQTIAVQLSRKREEARL